MGQSSSMLEAKQISTLSLVDRVDKWPIPISDATLSPLAIESKRAREPILLP